MRLSIIATAMCLTVSAATVALAQPKALFRPVGKPDSRGNDRDKDKDKDKDNSRMCHARRNILSNEEKRYESTQAEVAGLEAEIASLQRRLDEIKRQRDDEKRTLATLEKRYKKANDMYQKECGSSNSCTTFETDASDLSRRSDEVEKDLDVVRSEIRENKTEISRLEKRIAPLQREYSDKQCNNLVPGETDQTVIDRCSAIFSDWNRMQGDLNRSNNRVPALRSRYESLLAELKNLEKRAGTYESYLAKNCSDSKETAKMRGFGARRERAQSVGQELDSLISDITKLRGVKITVSAQ